MPPRPCGSATSTARASTTCGAHGALAGAHLGRGRLDLAEPHAAQSLRAAREAGDPSQEVDALLVLASVHRLRGRLTPAADHLTAALAVARRCGFRHQQAEAHAALAPSTSPRARWPRPRTTRKSP